MPSFGNPPLAMMDLALYEGLRMVNQRPRLAVSVDRYLELQTSLRSTKLPLLGSCAREVLEGEMRFVRNNIEHDISVMLYTWRLLSYPERYALVNALLWINNFSPYTYHMQGLDFVSSYREALAAPYVIRDLRCYDRYRNYERIEPHPIWSVTLRERQWDLTPPPKLTILGITLPTLPFTNRPPETLEVKHTVKYYKDLLMLHCDCTDARKPWCPHAVAIIAMLGALKMPQHSLRTADDEVIVWHEHTGGYLTLDEAINQG